jgi:membrane protease YdiL (CAAX protease family)
VTSAALLAWSNGVVPRLPAAIGVRTAANLGATAALLFGTRSAGLTAAELGTHRSTRRTGTLWGVSALGAAAAGYLAALAVPAGRRALADSAPGDSTPRELAARLLVHIPLGTVLCEEVAFRGVLLALANRQLPRRAASAWTAAAFGLWHVHTAGPGAAAVARTVLVTGLGGVLLGGLRTRSGSLLAPIGLHLGTNVVGLLAAVAATQFRNTSRARRVSASVQPSGGAMTAQASTS